MIVIHLDHRYNHYPEHFTRERDDRAGIDGQVRICD